MAAQLKGGGGRKPPEKKAVALAGPVPKEAREKSSAKMISASKLKELASEVASLAEKGASVRGSIGALIKDAENDYGIHREAFKLAVKYNKKEPDQRAAFLMAFDHYRECLKLDRDAQLPFGDD